MVRQLESNHDFAYQFERFLDNASCITSMKLSYRNRCHMARKVTDCKKFSNFFNYFEIMYCTFTIKHEFTEFCVMLLFAIIYGAFLCILYMTINEFYSPTLKIFALKLRMNEYMAGVLLVAISNSTPDLLVNFASSRSTAPTMNAVMSKVLTIILLSGGTICFIRPFTMNGCHVVRDLLFLLLAIELSRYFIIRTDFASWIQGAILLSIYPLYIAINIIDLILLRHTIRKLRSEISILSKGLNPVNHRLDEELMKKIRLLNKLEEEDDIKVHESYKSPWRTGLFITPKALYHRRKVDVNSNRNALYNKANPKNLFLFEEFLQSINPIDKEKWELNGTFWRAVYILRSPIVLFLLMLIPKVSYESIKHGWSKMLNCLQIVLNPFVASVLVETMVSGTFNNFHLQVRYSFAVSTLFITIPLALAIFYHSRTDIPPPYHIVFSVLTLFSVLIVVLICSCEMEVLVSIIGVVFNLSSNFMTITFSTISAVLADILAYAHLAKQGYGKMAFGAVIGGGMFTVVVTIGVEMLIRSQKTWNIGYYQVGSNLMGEQGENMYIFLIITIVCTFWWSVTFNFSARRSAGIFMLSLFVLYNVYMVCVEFELIHDFGDDEFLPLEGTN
ncbi:mitochondrial sodium/calcium exchanger protein [Drosophila bipectinata]|uniref:mitochondrial sodium/calcium exchanger protein n=1 Tax=Drosophila bipectinata TaxID=42026 RepID=UPI001C89D594|nr:mitochondrial sodium/calcium exchanger protein [Drosophila bipectinata]